LDEGREECRPARRRAARRIDPWARCRRRVRRAYLHRPGLCPRRRAGRCARGADPRCAPARLPQSRLCRPRLRQQCGALVGLPLQRPDYRTEAARGRHDLRTRRQRRPLGARGLQLPLGAADRPVRRRAPHDRLPWGAGRPCAGRGASRHPQGRAHSGPAAFRGHCRRAAGGEFVDSVPPGYFGGNVDNWRIGKGAVMYYPVAVPGALFSVGDPHASQGDGELCGTAIECSLTGTFQLLLHKRDRLAGTMLADLDYPLLETGDEWVVHGFSFANYLAALGDQAQSEIFAKSSLDRAMRDAFRKMRHLLMTAKRLTEDEAISLMSVAVDFGVTQVADGNWGIHAILKKALFSGEAGKGIASAWMHPDDSVRRSPALYSRGPSAHGRSSVAKPSTQFCHAHRPSPVWQNF